MQPAGVRIIVSGAVSAYADAGQNGREVVGDITRTTRRRKAVIWISTFLRKAN
ncbi:hypothetical protein KCP73_07450 [Salmonella enterica subsp. enterica]|nr:hypothetical protein KCP73_07450 [Salmonella enterica subsp. enterica]